MMGRETCEKLLEGLQTYLDGEASADLCARIERHLADCADCRVVLATLRHTIELYHNLPQPGLPAEARHRLYAVLGLEEFIQNGVADESAKHRHTVARINSPIATTPPPRTSRTQSL